MLQLKVSLPVKLVYEALVCCCSSLSDYTDHLSRRNRQQNLFFIHEEPVRLPRERKVQCSWSNSLPCSQTACTTLRQLVNFLLNFAHMTSLHISSTGSFRQPEESWPADVWMLVDEGCCPNWARCWCFQSDTTQSHPPWFTDKLPCLTKSSTPPQHHLEASQTERHYYLSN